MLSVVSIFAIVSLIAADRDCFIVNCQNRSLSNLTRRLAWCSWGDHGGRSCRLACFSALRNDFVMSLSIRLSMY